jgi:hypothetical protein
MIESEISDAAMKDSGFVYDEHCSDGAVSIADGRRKVARHGTVCRNEAQEISL